MKVTDTMVEKNIKERIHEVIADIQALLGDACCNNCKDCEFQYLCVRDEDANSAP